MSARFGWLALLVAGIALPAAAQPALHDGELVRRDAGDPAAAVAALSRQGAAWIGWTVPGVPEAAELCCHERRSRGSACSLATRGDSWGSGREGGRPTRPADLFALAEIEGGAARRIELVGATCPVDGAGRRVVWLDGVDPERSLDWFASIARRSVPGHRDRDLADSAVAAIAYHAARSADDRLAALARDPAVARDAREGALFWSGELRGEAGFGLLDSTLSSEPDGDLREHALFALTLSRDERALPRLLRAATEDADPDLRGQALFWLGQSGDSRAAGWIVTAIASDRDGDVREQGVFALSQLDDAAPRLVQLMRESDDPEVRRQALFWLGQSEDPRALAALEDLLNAGG